MALYSLILAHVLLRIYSLTHSLTHCQFHLVLLVCMYLLLSQVIMTVDKL